MMIWRISIVEALSEHFGCCFNLMDVGDSISFLSAQAARYHTFIITCHHWTNGSNVKQRCETRGKSLWPFDISCRWIPMRWDGNGTVLIHVLRRFPRIINERTNDEEEKMRWNEMLHLTCGVVESSTSGWWTIVVWHIFCCCRNGMPFFRCSWSIE